MTGTLYGLGLGPGDPELLTVKALRILRGVPVVAYPAPDTGPSFARSIVAGHLARSQVELPIVVPMRVETQPAQAVYDRAAEAIAGHLSAGRDVGLLCEGDPFFYGSFMYLFERLADRFATEIIPGIASVHAASAAARRPLASRNACVAILPAPLEDEVLRVRIAAADSFAIIKLGRHYPRIRALLDELDLTAHCTYCERVGLASERVLPLAEVTGAVPYFSLILGGEGTSGGTVRTASPEEAS
ncbi:precorrin-2 C(20)-methyltransferase [Mangrovibrevibacter kandeliae]|uniref:precorrin-2 C(20)-methyltransferase n=1 Tax=Mangrovibrevibacter kandeliae TaxID=2968473 RepID=UPI0021183C54|nr:precorrin-2 C(20)-methyltransferase [Aurantimonas sp. CSK15Z-1]MCQ8784351.1 precorrin-2 C(20)-methyltransferase [Aurantimonas sp. CSK15Z-1]